MSKNISRLAALLVGALLLVAAAVVLPADTQAATLSGGAYTYVINGEEVAFAYDPIIRKDGVLLPLDLFTHLGVQVTGPLGRSPGLTYGPVSAQLTLGRTVAVIDGVPTQTGVAPVRLNGRLFVPAALLEHFGLSFAQEGNYVTINQLLAEPPALTSHPVGDWKIIHRSRGFVTSVKSDATFIEAGFYLLDEAMLTDGNLAMSYGARTRLLGLLETNTLVLVNLSNTSFKSGALQPGGLFLIDANRNQYDVLSVIDIGQGLVSSKLAPGADRMGVLMLPRLAGGAGAVKLYYDANGLVLGQFESGR
ncbi:MAG: stalk domain-containing protein [Bacillota bacterium]